MPRATKVDAVKLYNDVKKGMSLKDLRAKYGLKTTAQINKAIVDAQVKLKELPALKKGGRAAGRAASELKVKVGKRGSIAISPKIVAALGFKTGEKFLVAKRAGNITLKKI